MTRLRGRSRLNHCVKQQFFDGDGASPPRDNLRLRRIIEGPGHHDPLYSGQSVLFRACNHADRLTTNKTVRAVSLVQYYVVRPCPGGAG